MNDVPNWLVKQEALRSRMSVSLDDYKNAVQQLVSVAQEDTSGSSVAAQVLLSIYNSRNWQLDISDLVSLDYENLNAALIAIRGWLFVREYPHNIIDNGAEIFQRLEKQWQPLHVCNRYKRHY